MYENSLHAIHVLSSRRKVVFNQSINHFSYRLVLVQDFDLCKELMQSDMFSGRNGIPAYIEMRGINGRHVGIAFTHSQMWRANLKFSLSVLKGIKGQNNASIKMLKAPPG